MRRARADRRDRDRAGSLRRRRRRRELVRARCGRHRLRGPGLRRALARGRPAARRRRGAVVPARAVPVVRSRSAAHAHAQRPDAPALRVHAAARRASRGLRRRQPRVGSCWSRGSRRPTACSCATRSTSSAGAWPPTMRAGRVAARRRRRAHDAAVHGPGPLLGRARRSEPRVAAGPHPARARRTTTCSTATRPSASRTNEWIVNLSTEMGRVSCTLDPQAAAERDAALRADGRAAAARAAAAGGRARWPRDGRWPASRAVQGVGPAGRREGRFDDLVGKRFVLLTRRDASTCPPSTWRSSSAIGAQRPSPSTALEDLDGRADRLARRARPRRRARAPRRLRLRRRRGARRRPRAGRGPARPPVHHRFEGHRPCPLTPSSIPKFHHVNLKTTRLQEMIDWYAVVVGTEVLFQNAVRAPGPPTTRPTTGSRSRRSRTSSTTRSRTRRRACTTRPSNTAASRSSTPATCA